MTDQLYNALQTEEIILTIPQKTPLTYKDLQVSVYLTLEDLLNTIETQFPKYFNINAFLPNRKRILAMHQFSVNLSDLNDLNNLIPSKLFTIITNPVKDFIDNPSAATYRKLNYLIRYLKEISSYRNTDNTVTNLSEHIQRKLIAINFNSLSFFNWVTTEILNKINDLDDITAKLEKLSWYLKEINQIPVISGLYFNPNQKSIKELLSEWIIEEHVHIENNAHRLAINSPASENQTIQNFKLVTDLSVPQLAFLIRSFMQTGLYKNKNDDVRIAKLFASNTKTKGTLTISPKSLRQHFYKNDDKTREVVKTAIIKILNYIQTLN